MKFVSFVLFEQLKRPNARGPYRATTREKPAAARSSASSHVAGPVIEMGEAHDEWGPMPTMFYVDVDDVDAWYRRALAAGAASMDPPALQPYGERRAAVRDAFGNQWYLAAPAS